MLRVTSHRPLENIEGALAAAAERRGGALLAVTQLGRLLHPDARDNDANVYTVCQTELYAALMSADIRFGAFIPCRIAAIRQASTVTIESISPKQFCRLLNRTDLDHLVAPLESFLQSLMEEAGGSDHYAAGATTGAVETQVNHRGTIAQRIDCHGTKIEDLAGTGKLDAPGG